VEMLRETDGQPSSAFISPRGHPYVLTSRADWGWAEMNPTRESSNLLGIATAFPWKNSYAVRLPEFSWYRVQGKNELFRVMKTMSSSNRKISMRGDRNGLFARAAENENSSTSAGTFFYRRRLSVWRALSGAVWNSHHFSKLRLLGSISHQTTNP